MIFQMGRASSTTNQQFDLEILIYGPWVGTLAGVGVTEAGALGLDFFLTMQIRGWQCKSVCDEGKLDGSFRKLEGHLVELIGKQMIIMENTHTIKGRNWKQQR